MMMLSPPLLGDIPAVVGRPGEGTGGQRPGKQDSRIIGKLKPVINII